MNKKCLKKKAWLGYGKQMYSNNNLEFGVHENGKGTI
jgi:hypothetical protein